MKIINQTPDELVLKEGSGFNLVFSIGFMLFGIGLGYMMYRSGQQGNLFLISLIPFTIGFLWFLFVPSVVVNVNKTTANILYKKERIIGTRVSNYSVADVSRVETRKNWKIVNEQNTPRQGFSTNSRRGLQLIVQSFLIMKDGKELSLNSVHGGKSGSSTVDASNAITEHEVSVAEKVADFIGVPFQEIGPPQVAQ